MIRHAGMPAPSVPDLLRIEGVVKRFGGRTVLDDLALRLGTGESLGVTGPNGCGKTTLIDVICGFLRPDRGRIWLAGREITGWPAHRVVRAGIARTFQQPRLAVRLTVEESLEAATLHRHLGGAGRRREVNRILHTVGLADVRRREGWTLPPGAIRRVQVGCVLATGGRLLCLDEPFASLRPEDTPEVVSVLRRLRREGVALLLVAHSPTLLQALCDRIAVIESGRVVRTGSPAEVLRA